MVFEAIRMDEAIKRDHGMRRKKGLGLSPEKHCLRSKVKEKDCGNVARESQEHMGPWNLMEESTLRRGELSSALNTTECDVFCHTST